MQRYAILCYHDEATVNALTKEQDDALMADLEVVRRKLRRRQARPGRPADADHRGDHLARRRRAAGHRRPVRRDQGAAARLLHRRLRDRSRRRSSVARDLARAASRAATLRDPPDLALPAGKPRDVSDLAWIDAALTVGAPPGAGRAAALFPRSRHGRGGVPGGLPAGAENWPQQRPAARSGRLADLRRPQRRARRGAPPERAAGRCRPRS